MTHRRALTELSIPDLVKKLDEAFSVYIRGKHAVNGYCACITCKKINDIEHTDAGHYISRKIKATRWDERNVWPQCRYCNRFLEGQKHLFRAALVEKLGQDEVEKLEADSRATVKLDRSWLIDRIKFYRARRGE